MQDIGELPLSTDMPPIVYSLFKSSILVLIIVVNQFYFFMGTWLHSRATKF